MSMSAWRYGASSTTVREKTRMEQSDPSPRVRKSPNRRRAKVHQQTIAADRRLLTEHVLELRRMTPVERTAWMRFGRARQIPVVLCGIAPNNVSRAWRFLGSRFS
jgi:hypothetical protein